ncbi:universal stress protein [Methylovirgula sp. 4M-Z18]|uniref:universal stress protein n=1 Tax=Methylovirgula sp. 4M-Z18 TaxID=2293567 RepID=UPI000E2E90DE|nr:universal stress protein [Methylovirgula sp. 4M-Z18]
MAYKDIVIYLDPSFDTDHRLKLAIAIAREHGARLVGVDATSQAAFDGEWRDRATGLQNQFEEAIRTGGIDGIFRSEVNSRNAHPHPDAHCADLIIAPQPLFEARDLVAKAIPQDVVLTAGVPVLILPHEWRYSSVGKKIVIAWNASREATRAVHDALPILRRADKVTVFTFSFKARPERNQERIIDHLRRHGVPATAYGWRSEEDISPIVALFSSLDTIEADLIVAGAYGQSPTLEKWLGGASHDLMESLSVPLLVSH